MDYSQIKDQVSDYYANVLSTNLDLKTSACCDPTDMPQHIKEIASMIHEDVTATFYGCGLVTPPTLENQTVLDLGSGTGRDCFILSRLVGPKGKVIGIDMTEEQLSIARKYQDFHAEKFGYESSNIDFIQGDIENLESANILSNSVDVIVSNCVINLSTNKKNVFEEIFRVLKPGGELFFSDVFVDRRLPKPLQDDQVLMGECLAGAMYTEDFRRLMAEIGFTDYRIIKSAPIQIQNQLIQDQIGLAKFQSLTVRAFKLDLEDRCEDYGQIATYLGGIPEAESAFFLDDHHLFEKFKPMPVCSNTAKMLSETRFAPHFKVDGNLEHHFGLFSCAPEISSADVVNKKGACC